METIVEGIHQVLGRWWWYGQDGRTKTAGFCDDWLLPLVVAVSLSATVVFVWWCCR
jgi:hypothetical protein